MIQHDFCYQYEQNADVRTVKRDLYRLNLKIESLEHQIKSIDSEDFDRLFSELDEANTEFARRVNTLTRMRQAYSVCGLDFGALDRVSPSRLKWSGKHWTVDGEALLSCYDEGSEAEKAEANTKTSIYSEITQW